MFEKYSNIEYNEFSDELDEQLNHPKHFWRGVMQCYVKVEKLHKKVLFKKNKEKLYWFVLGNKGNTYFFKESNSGEPKMEYKVDNFNYMTVESSTIEISNKKNNKKYLVKFLNLDNKKKFDEIFTNLQRTTYIR
jgi:hypothetical protein